MKNPGSVLVTLSSAGCLLLMAGALNAGPRDAQWRQVDEAIRQGLPKTAITNLEPIIQGALRDHAYAEAVKAIGKKIALEGNIQGNKPEERIIRLEAEIAREPKEMGPVLNTLLAHWYWQYFVQNRWRFMQRTATAQAPGKDFTTWDLPRLFAEIDKNFQKALAAESLLQAAPINAWDDLLVKGTMPDSYRPTLYDFIAHEALDFYTSGEQAGARPEDAFELDAASPILDPYDKFLNWKPGTADTEAPAVKAIVLYQKLLRFHQADPAPRLAFADLDLGRLTWGGNVAFGEAKIPRYQAALERFSRTYADFDISALAMEHQARLLQQASDLVGAHELASRAATVFPKSPGGRLCRNLVLEIESKSVELNTERVWNCVGQTNAPVGGTETQERHNRCPTLNINYRNVDAVFFRAIPYDWEVFLQQRHNRPENLSEQEKRQILAQKPALEWSEALASTTNYQPRTIQLNAPDGLKPGFYFIAASHEPGFGEKENVVSMTSVWVSDLSLITRTRDGSIDGLVLDAGSGEPLAGAEISVWHLDNTGQRIADPTLTTDADGFFILKSPKAQNYLFRARLNARELATAGDLWGYDRTQVIRPEAQTVFFTDRSIYRPGQTIAYKGICLWVDQSKDNYEPLKGEELTVVFKDQNGKEIARQKRRANDFGSFSGSFTAPRDRLMGQMLLEVQGRPRGATSVRVEEYKRPKFQVTLESPGTAAKLREKVNLIGHATSYTGAAIDGASAKYRVVRDRRMPWWWYGRGGGMAGSESQEIAHGVVGTGTDGSFKIEFIAVPDPAVSEKDEPTFTYHVSADITDNTGETRSAQHSIRIGYSALEAMISADDWQTVAKPVELKLETKTLDGEPQIAEGTVKVYELTAPAFVHRASLGFAQYRYYSSNSGFDRASDAQDEDLSDPNHWPLGKVVAERGFTTGTNGLTQLSFTLSAGCYRALVETQDRFGKKVAARLPLQVLQPDDTRLALKIPHLLAAPDWQAQPGTEYMALWGTGYQEGRAFVEIEHRHKILQRYWTKPGQTQQQIKVPVTEEMRGGFTLHVTQVRDNRAYLDSRTVDVPWNNKDLILTWEHFVSKLRPGEKETWTAVIKPASTGSVSRINGKTNGLERFAAEMVATLYDESLDAFAPHRWPSRFNIFRQEYSAWQTQFGNSAQGFQPVFGGWERTYDSVQLTYRAFPSDLTVNLWGYGWFGRGGMAMKSAAALPASALASRSLAVDAVNEPASVAFAIPAGGVANLADEAPTRQPDLGQVTARKNLNETAFFFPQLSSDSNGVVRLTFTMPEALTRWHFMGFAHDNLLRSGFFEDHAVTAKDLMVQPNPPRFLREGDIIEFSVKVSNQSDQPQTGTVRLTFDDALQMQQAASAPPSRGGPLTAMDKLLGNARPDQAFSIPAKESRGFSWRIRVPNDCGFITYKAVGASASVSDGEEGAIPVLSRRILVTESLPLPIRGPGTKNFEFDRLVKSGSSKTLQHQSLTLQMVSHPAWYAVLALPYLMEYPYECSEQTFNRFYANALARSIVVSDPKIHRVFEQWRNTPALDSPLEKNADLKSLALEETPWLRQAESESQARRNVGILFDDNRMSYEVDHTLQKLAELQLPSGAWPWFPGGQPSDYITLYITTGFGRLRHLGVDVTMAPAIRSLSRLDSWMAEEYDRIRQRPAPEKYVPSATDALYLYGRSFFLKDQPIAAPQKPAVEFFLGQARKFWLETDGRQSQAQLAIALSRFAALKESQDATPARIMASLRERSVSSEELGMFWRDTELSWWWYRAPIETQALMIEAFDEVAHDDHAVEDCKVWLLKQKQTQDWKTTKATADAVYALLLRGKELLSSDALVRVKLDGKEITPGSRPSKGQNQNPNQPAQPEAGTGFYEVRFSPGEIKPKLGEITVTKVDQGVAWGSLHWQYLEDISKITPYAGTPLKLKKSLFTKVNTSRGKVLQAVNGPLRVGDELVVRVELRVDRDMEYVHLKDQRGSGTEPVDVLSGYRYQDGLAYYESTRDTASHFFIDYLPKGVYVFEYSTRVQLRGEYQTGVASIQCMYAPEFNGHSESIGLTVN